MSFVVALAEYSILFRLFGENEVFSHYANIQCLVLYHRNKSSYQPDIHHHDARIVGQQMKQLVLN